MEELLEKLTELLEVDELDKTKKFEEYDEWDSLASLSVIAMLDSEYGITMKHSEVKAFSSIAEFCEFVLKK